MGAALTPWGHARRVLPFIDVTEAEIYERLLTATAHLWLGEDSAGVTEVTDGNYLHLWQAGGTLRGLLAMLPDIKAFAEAMGCKGLEVVGRRGWVRALSRYGFVKDGDRMVLNYGR